MRLSGIVLGVAAAAMACLPAVAATAPVTVNPAARLSLASVRAVGRSATSSKKKSSLAGSALVIAVLAAAAVAAGVVVVATEDNSASS